MTTPRHTAALLCSLALGALALPGCGGTDTAAEAEQVFADGDRLLAEAKRAIAEQQAELTLVQTNWIGSDCSCTQEALAATEKQDAGAAIKTSREHLHQAESESRKD